MRKTWYDFYYGVIVRRVGMGSSPFRWEVQAVDGILPVQVSSERFRSMQAAYEAGQTWLANSPTLPLPRIAVSTAMLTDENGTFSNQDEGIDPELDALNEGFIATVAPVCPLSIG